MSPFANKTGAALIRKVEVVPYNPDWPAAFAAEAGRLPPAFKEILIALHHIGSTAIPGCHAKPIIDILAEVRRIVDVDDCNRALIALGYQPRGEFGIPGRRYFSRDQGGVRTHQIHAFQAGNPEIRRHLDFVAYLKAHPEHVRAYSRLKLELASRFPEDIEGYVEGKSAFIQEMDLQARQWSDRVDADSERCA